jgi:hydroxymethylpyrimidine pyrophosphatase-like HAD family hydrolase
VTGQTHIDSPENPSIMIDIDGTLLDKSYQLTDRTIFETIADLTLDNEWSIGLSSDSSVELMSSLSRDLGLNGPIIAEKGAVVYIDGVEYVNQETLQKFAHIYTESLAALKTALPTASFWFGDPAEAMRLNAFLGNPGDTVVLINTGRKCSFGLFVRYIDEKGPRIIDDLTELASGSVLDRCGHVPLDKDLNHDYGLLILSQPEITKRVGSLVMMDVLGLTEIGMVGNSMTDYIGNDIAKHYAVANASKELIELADYCSSFCLTRGVVDILKGLSSATGVQGRS